MMKISVIAFAIAAAMPALAADLPVRKADVVTVQQPYTGLYFGVLGGGAKTTGDVEFLSIPGTGNLKPSGYMLGGLVGAGTWLGNFFVGVEADVNFDFSKAKQPCGVISDCELKSGWFLTQRLVIGTQLSTITGAARRAGGVAATQWREGIQVPATLSAAALMPILTLGIAERRIEACVNIPAIIIEKALIAEESSCAKQWIVGPTFGGGFRLPVSSGFSLGAEYLYVKYNKHFSPSGGPSIFGEEFKAVSEHVGRLSLTGHF